MLLLLLDLVPGHGRRFVRDFGHGPGFFYVSGHVVVVVDP